MMGDINSFLTISRAEDVVFREVGGEAVLLNLRTGQYFGLDEVATVIWGLLADFQSVSVLLDLLTAQYDVSRETLEADLGRFIQLLRQHELITVTDR
jgi:hypothetical protein